MSKPIQITYQLEMAAGRDAGNRSMRAGGRTKWAVKDWNVACETFARLRNRESGDLSRQKPSEAGKGITGRVDQDLGRR